MSGGGRRGEVRIRDARPAQQASPGVHNRKARRAAKAHQRDLMDTTAADEARIAERVRQRFEQMRAEREAYWKGVSDADLQAMALERSDEESAGLGGPWFLPMLMDAVPRWAALHYQTADRAARAHELGEIIAYSQGAAAIADPDARASTKGEIAKVFNAIAEGLAIGAYCPGGATFAGLNWEVVGATLRVTNRGFCASYPVNDPAHWEAEGT